MAAGEPPEATRVVGASTGSVILILAGTVTVTTILALISKNIASVAKDAIGIANQIEDLRGKKLLNDTIEQELIKQETERKKEALEKIIDLVKGKVQALDGEKTNALESSVKKLLNFTEKGGNLDFVVPDSEEPSDDGSANDDQLKSLAEARDAVREYQAEREHIKLLEQHGQQKAA